MTLVRLACRDSSLIYSDKANLGMALLVTHTKNEKIVMDKHSSLFSRRLNGYEKWKRVLNNHKRYFSLSSLGLHKI